MRTITREVAAPVPRDAVADEPVCWSTVAGLSLIHVAGVAGIVWLIVNPSLPTLVLAASLYALTGLSITAGYHRLFAHRTYRASPPVRWLLLVVGAAAFQNSAISWSADHRAHHADTDGAGDPHAITRGVWFAHVEWLFRRREASADVRRLGDLWAVRSVRLQHRWYAVVAIGVGLVLPTAIAATWGDPWGGLLVAGFLRAAVLLQATFAINSLAHLVGSRRFDARSSARDSALTALVTFGEGYHNFHHRFPFDYRNGVRWWQYDPSKWLIWAMARLHVANTVRSASPASVERAAPAAAAPQRWPARSNLHAMTAEPLATDLRLTEWTSCGGCAAKWGASVLAELVGELPPGADPALLVGLAPFDDAAIYRIDDTTALVSTTDFFPPLVDDPADYGAIAAANACSDVFAMGGRVVLAINVAAFPEHFPRAAMAAIFDAAAAVVAEAGGTVAGGHTIRNPEPVFGLAVQGLVHPERVFRKSGARPGDVVVLSKPIGTGLTLAGGENADKAAAIAGMRTLNRAASEQLQALGDAVHAVTDVTGYGLAGHGWEVAERSGVRLVVDTAGLVAYPGAREAAQRGVRTGGDARNRDYVAGHLDSSASATAEALVFDPQTSGGLLAAVSPGAAADLADAGFWTVGTIEAGAPEVVLR